MHVAKLRSWGAWNDFGWLDHGHDFGASGRSCGRYDTSCDLCGGNTRSGGQSAAAGLSYRHDRRLNNLRRSHFEAIGPVCPVCRQSGHENRSLVISRSIRETDADVLEGILQCPDPDCLREFPILDGIPIIVAPVRQYISDNVLTSLIRDDLSAEMESLLGDCAGPGSAFDTRRQQLSAYAWDHYGDCDPNEVPAEASPGSIVRTLREALKTAQPQLPGPMIDLGCSVGRTTFELSEHHDELVLGVDLNFSMLQLASQVLRTGRVCYPRRRVGIVYDRRVFPFRTLRAQNVDFWACDLMALPLVRSRFSLALALNVLDCVPAPVAFLHAGCGLLRPGGKLILTTPFDWSPTATGVEGWLGGHSQRGVENGMSESFLRRLFDSENPNRISEMSIANERLSVPWQVRLHDRASMSYEMHLLFAEKDGPVSEPT